MIPVLYICPGCGEECPVPDRPVVITCIRRGGSYAVDAEGECAAVRWQGADLRRPSDYGVRYARLRGES